MLSDSRTIGGEGYIGSMVCEKIEEGERRTKMMKNGRRERREKVCVLDMVCEKGKGVYGDHCITRGADEMYAMQNKERMN